MCSNHEKPTLVLVPGLLCDADVWRRQAEHLQDLCRIVVPDFTDCAGLEEVLARIVGAAPATFLLAGHSMGGWLALEVVKRHPERIAKLCLLDTTAETDTPAVAQHRIAMMADFRSGRVAEVIDGIIDTFVIQRRAVPEIRRMFLRNQAKFLAQEELMLSRQDCVSAASQAPPGTLLIVGRGDHGFYPAMTYLRGLLPASRLAVIEDSGHMVTMEQPDEVTSLLRDWIQRS